MRYVFGFMCVCALGVIPMIGCSEDSGTGGTGGTDLCEGITCEDTECKIDGVCNASDGMCDYTAVEDGTACSDGECLDGVCAPVGAFPCTEQGIRDAIDAGGGPHFFACDGPTTVVTEAEIVIDSDVTLDGEGNLTVDGGEDHRVFSVPEGLVTELRGLSVSHGTALGDPFEPFEDRSGGGIRNEGTLTLTNSTVSGNTSYDFGGGIGNEGTLTLTNSTVSRNTSYSGGGIRNEGTLTLTNSTVSDNTAAGGGGIMNVNGGTLTLTNSTVSGNSAEDGGGGGIINVNGGTLTLTHSTVSGNSAEDGGGGGIYNDGTLTLTHSTVSGNSASHGGGIDNTGNYYSSGTLTLTHSTVSGNSASGDGGGIANGGNVTLTSSTVSNNSAGGNGGGIYSAGEGGKVLTLTNSTVSENSAGGSGGAIYNTGAYYSSGILTLTNSTVSENSAGGSGGAIYNTGDGYADVSLRKTTVSENSAENSGGGLWNDGYLNVWNSTVSGNTGAFAGGIWSFGMGSGLTLSSSTVSGNITFANDVADIFGSQTYITNTLVNNDCSIHRLAGVPGGYNVESPGDTCGFDQPTDQVSVSAEDLNLGPLADNGGPTWTHALLSGSVAIDAMVCTGGEDQRGVARPQGPACDVGAFELEVAR